MRPLTTTAGGIKHGSFGGTPVDDECTAATGSRVGKRETDHVLILVKPVAIAYSVCARSCGALGQNDNETGEGNGEDQGDVAPVRAGQAKLGQAAGNDANNPYASILPMEHCTRPSHPDHGEQSAWKTRGGDIEDYDHGQDRYRDEQGWQLGVRNMLKREQELAGQSVPSFFDTEHLMDFA